MHSVYLHLRLLFCQVHGDAVKMADVDALIDGADRVVCALGSRQKTSLNDILGYTHS